MKAVCDNCTGIQNEGDGCFEEVRLCRLHAAASDMKLALKKIANMFPPEHPASVAAMWAVAKSEEC